MDTSDGIAATLLGAGLGVLVFAIIILYAIAGAILGAFGGWILMWLGIAPWVYAGFAQFGFHVTTLWQVGAAFGFTGAFFKASLECKHKND